MNCYGIDNSNIVLRFESRLRTLIDVSNIPLQYKNVIELEIVPFRNKLKGLVIRVLLGYSFYFTHDVLEIDDVKFFKIKQEVR